MDMAIRRLGTPPRLPRRHLQHNPTTSTRRPRKRNRMHMGNLTHHNKQKKRTKKYKQIIREKKHNKTKTGQWHCELIFHEAGAFLRGLPGGPLIFFLALCWCTGIPYIRERKQIFFLPPPPTPDQSIQCILGLYHRLFVKLHRYYKAPFGMQTSQGEVRNIDRLTKQPHHHPFRRNLGSISGLLLTELYQFCSNSPAVSAETKLRAVQSSNPTPPAGIHCDFGGVRVLVVGIFFLCGFGQLLRCCSVVIVGDHLLR